MIPRTLIGLVAALASTASCLPTVDTGFHASAYDLLTPRNQLAPRASCANSPTARNCWGDYSIDTDYQKMTPDTGVTREYWLVAEELILAPDGYKRQVLAFNGTVPGPTIWANWGDNLIIHVTNLIPHNGTSVHWHGMRMLRNSEADGVPGVTQCPIAPNTTYTYRFRATQYGTSWYHSHFSYQTVDGLNGPLVINGPATANYDEDLGAVMLTDWAHDTSTETWMTTMRNGLFPIISNGLINGTNTFNCALLDPLDANCIGGGERFKMAVQPGKKYRIGLVGTQADGFIRFSIDGHKLTVIAADFTPIVPYTTDSVLLGGGQRYDIIVTANQTPGNFWIRSTIQSCNVQLNLNGNNIKGQLTYEGVAAQEPKTSGRLFPNNCYDEDRSDLVPYVKKNVGPAVSTSKLPLQWYCTSFPRPNRPLTWFLPYPLA
jgi:hypothetical protein